MARPRFLVAWILGFAVVAGLSAPPVGSQDLRARTPDPAVAAATSQAIRARYEAAAKISSTAQRDKEYGTLIGYASGAGDFELAMEIAARISAAGTRDTCYARIVYQAMKLGDIAAADRAAEKISSVILRDEQFKKIGDSCPSNTTTEGAASVLGLDGGKPKGPVHRSDRER